MQSRRRFLMQSVASVTAGGLAPAQEPGPVRQLKPLYEGFAIEPRKAVQEAILAKLDERRYWLLFGENKRMVRKVSADRGRSWGATEPVLEAGGKPIEVGRDNLHLSFLRLRSGSLGIVYGGPYARPGRDGTMLFRSSHDQGATWSAAVVIDPIFSLCRTGGARVLSTGRIVVPAFKWISSFGGGDSENEANSINFSWAFYSDDEGRSWSRSLSELFISVDDGRLGVYSFEEPSLEELRDGSLLMFGRSELGRFYQSVSKDHGVNWSAPKPVNLAAAYAPPMLARISSTGDLLLVWNQASGEEILSGLSRHRLSTAVSRDDGLTWSTFRNLESLDDRERLASPPATPHVYRMVDYEYRQPVDRLRYKHAPGCLRICYPTVVFHGDEVAFAYDYGYGVGELEHASATKIKIVPVGWLYGK